MSLGNLGNGAPSPEELERMQEEQERQEIEREQRQQAQQLVGQEAMERPATEPGYWDTIGSADIGDHDNLEQFAQAELSDKHALANIRYEDWKSWSWRIETEFWSMLNEFRDSNSKMDDDDLRIMYGENRPELDNEKARRLRSASQVKKLMTSLSIDARGLRSGTEIHAVSKHEKMDDTDDDEGGILSGAKSWLSG